MMLTPPSLAPSVPHPDLARNLGFTQLSYGPAEEWGTPLAASVYPLETGVPGNRTQHEPEHQQGPCAQSRTSSRCRGRAV